MVRTLKKKRAQGRPGARCTRGLVCKYVRKNAHEHTGSAEAIRPSLRNGFTAYSVLPGDRALLPPSPADIATRQLDASVGASGPHGFAVRNKRFRPACICAPDAVASTASHPNVRDDREPPLLQGGT